MRHPNGQYSTCTVERVATLRHHTLDMTTGAMTDTGKVEVKRGPCDTPLFGDEERKTGICRSCAKGWEVAGNYFADRTGRGPVPVADEAR